MPRPKSADAVTREAIGTVRLAVAHLKQMLSQAGLQPELKAELIREMRLNSAKLTRLEAKLRPVGRPAQKPVVPHPVAPAEQRKKVWADFTLEERQGMARFGFDVETGEALPETEPRKVSPAPAVPPVNAAIALAPTVIDELAEITVPAVFGGAVGALEMLAESAAPRSGTRLDTCWPEDLRELPRFIFGDSRSARSAHSKAGAEFIPRAEDGRHGPIQVDALPRSAPPRACEASEEVGWFYVGVCMSPNVAAPGRTRSGLTIEVGQVSTPRGWVSFEAWMEGLPARGQSILETCRAHNPRGCSCLEPIKRQLYELAHRYGVNSGEAFIAGEIITQLEMLSQLPRHLHRRGALTSATPTIAPVYRRVS